MSLMARRPGSISKERIRGVLVGGSSEASKERSTECWLAVFLICLVMLLFGSLAFAEEEAQARPLIQTRSVAGDNAAQQPAAALVARTAAPPTAQRSVQQPTTPPVSQQTVQPNPVSHSPSSQPANVAYTGSPSSAVRPAVQAPAYEAPVHRASVPRQPAYNQPVRQQPAYTGPVQQTPAPQRTVHQQPTVAESTPGPANGPTAQQPTANQPVGRQPAARPAGSGQTKKESHKSVKQENSAPAERKTEHQGSPKPVKHKPSKPVKQAGKPPAGAAHPTAEKLTPDKSKNKATGSILKHDKADRPDGHKAAEPVPSNNGFTPTFSPGPVKDSVNKPREPRQAAPPEALRSAPSAKDLPTGVSTPGSNNRLVNLPDSPSSVAGEHNLASNLTKYAVSLGPSASLSRGLNETTPQLSRGSAPMVAEMVHREASAGLTLKTALNAAGTLLERAREAVSDLIDQVTGLIAGALSASGREERAPPGAPLPLFPDPSLPMSSALSGTGSSSDGSFGPLLSVIVFSLIAAACGVWVWLLSTSVIPGLVPRLIPEHPD